MKWFTVGALSIMVLYLTVETGFYLMAQFARLITGQIF